MTIADIDLMPEANSTGREGIQSYKAYDDKVDTYVGEVSLI